MGCIAARDLSGWMIDQKLTFASASQIAGWIGCPADQVPHRLRGARQAGEMVCVTTGGWVPAVNGHLWGHSCLDAMMSHLGIPYYVGYLAAASIYGVSHQAIQSITVAAPNALKHRRLGYGALRFARKPNVGRFPTQIRQTSGWNGARSPLVVSTPEVTLLDLLDRPRQRGDHICLNAVAQMIDWFEVIPAANGGSSGIRHCPMINADALAAAANLYRVPTRQRLGFALDEMAAYTGRHFDTDPLRATLPLRLRHIDYDPLVDDYDREEGAVKHSRRWQVTLWRELDPDV